jgi:CarD family transcriptional regulator
MASSARRSSAPSTLRTTTRTAPAKAKTARPPVAAKAARAPAQASPAPVPSTVPPAPVRSPQVPAIPTHSHAPGHTHRGPPSYLPPGARLPSVPPGPAPEFKIGDKAVHPSHGLGEITSIETREFAGTRGLYYTLRIFDNGMKVMVPMNSVTQAGLRRVMSTEDADSVLMTMRAREVAVDLQPWSRRFRAYTEMIKSGLPHEVAKVLRDMHRLRSDKDLSFGERRLLDQAKSLLVKELAVAKSMTEAQLLAEVDQIFKA